MSFWAETFTFNSRSCTDFELMLYDIGDNGSEESEFASTVTVQEDTISGRWRPLFYGVKYQNKLTFELTFGVDQCRLDEERYLSRSEIDAIATWLTGHDEYHWLTIDQEDMEDIRYKCMITGLKLTSYGKLPFALQATVTCDSPYAYRTPFEQNYIVNGTASFTIDNMSALNGYFYPKVSYQRTSKSTNTLILENVTDGNRKFIINNIPNAVNRIDIDNDVCVITNDQDLNLYGGCNYKWLRLKPGNNVLNITANGTVTLLCEFPINVGG